MAISDAIDFSDLETSYSSSGTTINYDPNYNLVEGSGSGIRNQITTARNYGSLSIEDIQARLKDLVEPKKDTQIDKDELVEMESEKIIIPEPIEIGSNEPIKISVQNLIEDLRNGLTRCKGDTGYSDEKGSVEEKYKISKEEVKLLFSHPKLKNIRVRVHTPPKVVLVDEEEKSETPITEIKSKYGKPSKAAATRIAKVAKETSNTTEI